MTSIGPLGQDIEGIEKTTKTAFYSPAAGLTLLAMTALISGLFIYGNVNEEPLKLLGGTEE